MLMKRGTPRHPKIADFAEQLNLPLYSAVGLLELLWHFTAEFAPQGNVGRYSDQRIEAAMGWDRKRGRLIEVLTTTGWIDLDREHRLVVHDWHDHCDEFVNRKLQRASLPFLSISEKVTGICQTDSDTVSEKIRLPCLASALPMPQPYSVDPVVGRNGFRQPSLRFEEWWKIWSDFKGTANRIKAEHAWFNVVTIELEPALMECTRSYIASRDDPNKGYNPQNFLTEMATDKFTARWPPKKQPPKDNYENPYRET
jgi:hypothetical protein